MPIYEYGCHNCGAKFESLVVGSFKPRCPNGCSRRSLEQLVSTFAMSFTESKGLLRGRCANMFENFTVQNVRDKRTGKPIVVNSLKELRAAEKEHGFALAIASDNDINEAPQNESWAGDVTHDYNWKWTKDPKKRSDRVGVGVGVMKSPKEALA